MGTIARRKGLRVAPGERVRLTDIDPRDTLGIADRAEAEAIVTACRERLEVLQGYLAAERSRSLLVVLQGMDASGKDGAVRALVAGLNPMIVRMTAFGTPTKPELAHDFLWRITRELPEKGRIGLFNRSHYEDVLIVRVDQLVPEAVWRPRFKAIRRFEEELARQGTTVLKLMLHISPTEQMERQRERVQEPAKRWKFNADDLRKHDQWEAYMAAYEEAMERTGTRVAPWHVVPADRKWARNALILEAVVATLEDMKLPEPPVPADAPKQLLRAK